MQIGIVAKKVGVSVDAIRFYERNALLPRPARTQGGFRQYVERDVETLAFIRRVQGLGFKLREVRGLLSLRGSRMQPCAPVRRRLQAKLVDIRQKLANLHKLERELHLALRSCNKELPKQNAHCPILQEMDAKLQFPGLSNTWTMPVENRLDMELTGIKTPLGLKIQGPNLEGIQQVGAQVQQILSIIPEMRSIFAERVSQGFYLNVEVNRAEAARYGLTIADVQQAVTSGIGGEMVAENVEGRERYPVNVRYSRDFRDNVEELRRVLIGTPSGAQIPVSDVATISFSRGPSMIRDEDGALTGYVYIDLNTKDYGGFVTHANTLLKEKLNLPPGFTYKWSGEYEFELRAKERLQLILPIVFFVIFMLLYVVFHSVTEAAVLIFPTIYALTGGLILQELLGYNFSVAVWVGYIALFGIAVETGVVMVVYLHEALDQRLKSGVPLRHEDIEAAVIEGAVHRLRPKLMTVCVVLASLIPILWETGVGADVMKPIAAPLVGGMITSTIHVLILVPVFFALMKERALRRGTLRAQGESAPKD